MKKLLFTMTLLALTINANAQTKFGAKAGLNVSNLSGDSQNTDAKIGFHVGGYANIKFAEKFAFQPELLYSTQGAKESGEIYVNEQIGTVNADVKYKLDYINVPLMFKFYPTQGFNIEAGPQVGFLVSSKLNVETTALGQKIDQDVDMKDYLKSIDFGLNIGVGYEFSNGLNAGARYNFGLSNISDENEGDIKNSVFSVGLGYSF